MQAPQALPKPPLLELRGIRKTFLSTRLFSTTQRVVAASNVSFAIEPGQAVALVGESGSGKSTLARLVLRLDKPDGGELRLDGQDVLAHEPRGASLSYRARVQMVFQDPFGSLNPVHSVAHHLERPLLRHQRAESANVRARALELLHTVGLEPAEDFIDRRPYELSGGQRQRVAIARALAVDPDLLVADEPTSMLDVSIRMGILNLLARFKRERQLAILLITHDLASARYLADRVLVLYRGRIVEDGSSDAVIDAPAHPYTRALLASIANAKNPTRPTQRFVEPTGGEETKGCPFAPRCPDVFDICRTNEPTPRAVDGQRVLCHLYPQDAPASGS